MTNAIVRARIAHDAYVPGEEYSVPLGRARALVRANLVTEVREDVPAPLVEIRIPVEKGGRRGARKARQSGAVQDDPGGVPGEAGEGLASGDEPGEGFGAGGYGPSAS